MSSKSLKQILGFEVPKSSLVLYLCKFQKENIIVSDVYLIKILLVASKKAITRHWCKETPPTKKKLTNKLRLQEAQFDCK